MENAFFLPVGRHVVVKTTDNKELRGELKGIINFGGIPAIWLIMATAGSESIIEHVCLMNNVCSLTIVKKVDRSSTLIVTP